MCRNIKPLFNLDPPATDEEIYNASLQFVRKLSGFQKPSTTNEKAFSDAVKKISKDTKRLFTLLSTSAISRNRDIETEKARQRNLKRFGIK